MSEFDHALGRLLRSAARSPEGMPEAAPFGFETRVLARESGPGRANYPASLKIIRHGLVLASILMLIALALYYYQSPGSSGAEGDYANFAWSLVTHE